MSLEPVPFKRLNNDPFLCAIWRKAHWFNKSWTQFVLGQPGEGKSYSCLVIGEALDPKFNIDKVAWSIKEYIELINNISYPGEFIQFEEVGVGANAKKWHEAAHIALGEVAQTQRNRNPIVFMNVPLKKFSDPTLRDLPNAISTVKRYGFGPVTMKIRLNEPDFFGNKVLHPYPRLTINGRLCRYTQLIIRRKPSPELIEEYEKKAKKFKKKVTERSLKIALRHERLDREFDGRDIIEKIADEVMENLDNFRGERSPISWKRIKTVYGISRDKAQEVKEEVMSRLNLNH